MLWLYIVLAMVTMVTVIAGFIIMSSAVALVRAKGVPFVPLDKDQLAALNKHVKLQTSDKLIDLGCGDGRVLRMFENQGVEQADGYEINLWAVWWGRWQNWRGKSKTRIYLKDFNEIDLGQYDVVFCYLLESYLKRLREKFDKELKSGSKIVSYGFQIPKWREPSEVIYTQPGNKELGRIFIYNNQ